MRWKPQTIVIARARRLWRDRFFKLRLGERLGAHHSLRLFPYQAELRLSVTAP